jgi:hypothetical protein
VQKNGNNSEMLGSLMKKLGPEDRKKVQSLLADRKACEKILSTPEAQELIRKFTGGKK